MIFLPPSYIPQKTSKRTSKDCQKTIRKTTKKKKTQGHYYRNLTSQKEQTNGSAVKHGNIQEAGDIQSYGIVREPTLARGAVGQPEDILNSY